MKFKLAAILLAALCVPSLSMADPWKDESGHGRGRRGWAGETPGWARGRGYWDGHHKHSRPRFYGRWSDCPPAVQPYIYPPPAVYSYPPPAPYDYGRGRDRWDDRDDWYDD